MFKPLPVKENAFDKITPQSAYWIGFLLADGCVADCYKKPRIILALCRKDHRHAEKFRDFVGCCKHKVRRLVSQTNYGEKVYSRVDVSNARLIKQLAKHGVQPRKTGHEKATGALKFNPHFWRGVVDGDGCVMLVKNHGYHYPAIELGGTYTICRQFNAYAARLGVRQSKITWCRSLRVVRFNGAPAKTLIKSLYTRPPCLERKAAIARRCCAWQPISRRAR